VSVGGAYDPVVIGGTGPATQAEVGPCVTGADVEGAVLDTLRSWLPSYLSFVEGAHGLARGSTPVPRGWAVTGRDLAKLNSDQLPCVVVMTGGILEAPRKEGAPGCLTCRWSINVGAIFAAAWGGKSRQHAQLYVRAISLVMLQRPLQGIEAVVDLRGETYDEMDFESSRSYSASIANFNVDIREVVWAQGGPPPYVAPPTDPTQPLDPWVPVTDTDVEVEHVLTDLPT